MTGLSFKLYVRESAASAHECGRYWRGENFSEHLALCSEETVEPVFSQLLPRDGIIVEAGCGLGRWVIHFRSRGYRIIGLDNSLDALCRMKEFDGSLPVMAGDVLGLPLGDESVEAVMSLGVVEHFEEGPGELFREMHRVLTRDGLLFVSVPHNSRFRRLVTNNLIRVQNVLLRSIGYPMRFSEYRYTGAELRHMVARSGFEVISLEPEDFVGTRCMGLTDFPQLLGTRRRRWELNLLGRAVARFFRTVSFGTIAGGILCVAKKRPDS